MHRGGIVHVRNQETARLSDISRADRGEFGRIRRRRGRRCGEEGLRFGGIGEVLQGGYAAVHSGIFQFWGGASVGGDFSEPSRCHARGALGRCASEFSKPGHPSQQGQRQNRSHGRPPGGNATHFGTGRGLLRCHRRAPPSIRLRLLSQGLRCHFRRNEQWLVNDVPTITAESASVWGGKTHHYTSSLHGRTKLIDDVLTSAYGAALSLTQNAKRATIRQGRVRTRAASAHPILRIPVPLQVPPRLSGPNAPVGGIGAHPRLASRSRVSLRTRSLQGVIALTTEHGLCHFRLVGQGCSVRRLHHRIVQVLAPRSGMPPRSACLSMRVGMQQKRTTHNLGVGRCRCLEQDGHDWVRCRVVYDFVGG
mmetsp:Transcript_45481/g.95483  ORF Transcript_45481/g.95483 Transcript_45481/m.95483 type:complete len:365 (-) Transcript_45481:239-1333(-)